MPQFKDLNEFAKQVTLEEAGKKQVSIAQVKEILSKMKDLLAPDLDLYTLIKSGLPEQEIKEPSFGLTVGQAAEINAAINVYDLSRKNTQDGIALASRVSHIIGRTE